ncbi:hypothetical protein RHGRI_019573 [Rhododendron griersonianum]|uniref:Protein FRA10AC1 n=1 Tax=Rhododendron griersonianum TaxID=479676 RepID=A0AAV6JKG5_9ERIC|nr:hypothetical protein RHGRI_019573 [Rhododendron griersonianum]
MASFASLKSAIFDKEARKQQYQAHIRGLNAYDRHKKFVNDYAGFYGKGQPAQEKLPVKTDQDTLREGYRFIRSEEDDLDPSWEQKLVKRYYDKLFKEYCIADMSQYKSGKIGLRWRVEKEVISGKGQFVCGNKHCNEKDGLASYEENEFIFHHERNERQLLTRSCCATSPPPTLLQEIIVNFSYFEAGENKQALVKLVTCERCAEKLLYKKRKEKEQLRKREKEELPKKRERSESGDDTDTGYGRSKERRRVKELELVSLHWGMQRRQDSTSASGRKSDEGENFDEFLEGMFP